MIQILRLILVTMIVTISLTRPSVASAGILPCLNIIVNCSTDKLKATPTPTPTAKQKTWQIGGKLFQSYAEAQSALQRSLFRDIDTIFQTLLDRPATDKEKAEVSAGITVESGYVLADLTQKIIDTQSESEQQSSQTTPQTSPLATPTTLAAVEQAAPAESIPTDTPDNTRPSPQLTGESAVQSSHSNNFGLSSVIITLAILAAVLARPIYRLFHPAD